MPMILYYDINSPQFPAETSGQWDLSNVLPSYIDPNKGLEAAMFISDAFLVANKFYDESAQTVYTPSSYPNHGNGLICVGLEHNGYIYCFAVDKTENNKFTMIASW